MLAIDGQQRPGVSRAGSIAALLATLLISAGCVSDKPQAKSAPAVGAGPVEEIHLYTTPFAVNLDGVPGPDGLAAKVYASNQRQPQPVAIANATLEVMMFNGVLDSMDLSQTTPLHTWKFTPEELRQFQGVGSIGVGYQLALPWGKNRPTKSRMTVLARLTTEQGKQIYSAPSIVTLSK